WFESGSMPYAQNHYPFENAEAFDRGFPADFIAEGLDQTRGWFYTLTVLSSALFNRPAFKNVVVNGIVLAEDGNKMSKRLRNYPDPKLMIDRYGADAIRLYLLHSPAVRGEDLCFTEKGLELVLRQILIPLWNSLSFFLMYAELYQWEYDPQKKLAPSAEIDRWILSLVYSTAEEVKKGMDAYDLNRAVEPLVGFVDSLTNWYIRRSRRRFWKEEASRDRNDAFATLHSVLLEFSKTLAPFVPFLADAIYEQLRDETMPESCHLCDFPEDTHDCRSERLENEMAEVRRAVSMGHSLRKDHKLKVRQPLSKAIIVTRDEVLLETLRQHTQLICEELNVKEVHFESDEETFVSLSPKPNFRSLGKRLGGMMKQAQELITKLNQKSLRELLEGREVYIQLDGEQIPLGNSDVEIVRTIKSGSVATNDGNLTLVLDLALTEELLCEGLAREMVNKINTMRREMGLEVTDRIDVVISSTDRLKNAYEAYKEYIDNEVLSVSTSFSNCEGQEWDLNGEYARIQLTKANS
ncbi:MAG: class I tRNA ligase family protein, partial [Chlamydiia bacterium]|nr:class I tRNA ligase family protein [Chlamydiia bacterium]